MQKKSLVITICVVVVIIAIILLVVYIVRGGSIDGKDIIKMSTSSLEPTVELSYEPAGTTESNVTIYINATIGGNNSIESIELPNGQVVTSNGAKYEVTKNGDYEFIIKGSNGVSTTKKITIDNIKEISADNPYIPEGFTQVSDTSVETGFVIEDSNGNQFVWVPVRSGSLTRNTDGNEQYEDKDNTATGLSNSVAKNYGFYIARYEASKVEKDGLSVATSKFGEIPWSNLTYEEAHSAALNTSNVFGYSGVKTGLVSSGAWDTTLSWLNESVNNYSTNTSYGNYTGTILKTGTTEMDEVNCICDMAGNLREWTTEKYFPATSTSDDNNTTNNTSNNKTENTTTTEEEVSYRVVRGGSANINKVANSHIGQKENLSDTYWGFRIVLYKD